MKFTSRLLVFASLIIAASSTLDQMCDNDDDCNKNNKERCQRYDACAKGRCVCQEGLIARNWVCASVAKIAGACNTETNVSPACALTAACSNNMCTCGGIPTDKDGINCRPVTSKAHGQSCSGGEFCGYMNGMCLAGTCGCIPDHEYKADVSPIISFTDPTVYSTATWGACLHKRSEVGLSEGKRCTDMATIGYTNIPIRVCEPTLLCATCPEWDSDPQAKERVCLKIPFNGAPSLISTSALLFSILAWFKVVY